MGDQNVSLLVDMKNGKECRLEAIAAIEALQQQVDELTERDNWLTGLVNQYRKLYGTTGIKAAQEKDND